MPVVVPAPQLNVPGQITQQEQRWISGPCWVGERLSKGKERTMLVIDGDGVGGLVGFLVVSDHHGDVEFVQTGLGEGDADVAAGDGRRAKGRKAIAVVIEGK
jgi:hypothetical protein